MQNLKPFSTSILDDLHSAVDYTAKTSWTAIFRSNTKRTGDSTETIKMENFEKRKKQIEIIREWLDIAENEIKKIK